MKSRFYLKLQEALSVRFQLYAVFIPLSECHKWCAAYELFLEFLDFFVLG